VILARVVVCGTSMLFRTRKGVIPGAKAHTTVWVSIGPSALG
jgi:hypothetical protein